MEQIKLSNDPNQEFVYELEGIRYRITLLSSDGMCYAEIYVNDSLKVASVLAIADQPLIPYQYINSGNLFFINTDNSESYPTHEKFGVTQFLYIASQAEIDAL